MADPAPDILDIPSEHPQPPSPSPLPSTTAPTTTTATPGPAPPASPSKRQVSMSLHPPAQIPLHHYESQPVLKPASPEMPPGLGQNDDRARWLGTASTRTSFTRVDLTRAPTPSEDDSAPGTGNGAAGSVAEVEGGAGAGEGVQAEQEEEEEEVAKEEEVAVPQTPQTLLTFLLVSGRRRTMSFEPETTVGRVKELVWNTWPSDWQDERPPAPAHLRILYLGRVLQDDDSLTKVGLPSHTPSSTALPDPAQVPTPTIVHLSIRPFAPPAEDDTKKKRRGIGSMGGGPDGEERGAGCCGCVVC